jgi:hypothetical protein
MADRIDCDGLLQQPVEELSPTAGCPSVKPEHEFIKIMAQIPMRYAALMDPKQPPLEQGRNPVNAGKVHHRGLAPLAIQDRRIMLVAQPLQSSIPLSPICDDHATSDDVLTDESSENSSAVVSDSFHPYSANLFASLFCRHTDENLVSFSANFGFVDLNFAVELLPTRSNHSPAQLVKHRPGSLVASQAQGSLQSQSADSALLIGDPPNGPEPEAQADLASFKDCARRDSDVPVTASTPQQAPRGLPNLTMPASWALDPFRPAETDQIFAASLFRSESMFEFEQSRGIS